MLVRVIMSVGKQSAFISSAGHAFNNPATRAVNEPSRFTVSQCLEKVLKMLEVPIIELSQFRIY